MHRVAAAWVLLLLASSAAAEELRFLTYNTHGLPALIARDDPEARFPVIGQMTQAYDVTLLQEDFAHHAGLREGAKQAVIERGNGPEDPDCGLCTGSGLTLLLGERVMLDALWNVPYQGCSGWLFGGADCWASKGFQLARLRTAEGALFYAVNTHLDAGLGDDDRAVRSRQLDQMRDRIQGFVGEAALVLVGDLNLNAARPADAALLEAFFEDLGLVDSGARAREGGPFQVLDYIAYRSGPATEITLVEAGEDETFVHEGEPLSDHPALFARLRVTQRNRAGP